MDPMNDSNPGWNMPAWVPLIQPNHFLKSSHSRSNCDEMVRMSHLMHWDAHVFHAMNAKSQLACAMPFSPCRKPSPASNTLQGRYSTQRNFKAFHFSIHSTLHSICDDLPYSTLPLLSDTTKTDFGSFVHRYVCLLILQRRYLHEADECEEACGCYEEINGSVGQNIFNLYYWRCQQPSVFP